MRNTDRCVFLINPDGEPLCNPVVDASNLQVIAEIKQSLQTIANCGDFVVIKSERSLDDLKQLFNDIPNLSFIAQGGCVIEHRGQKTDIVPPPDFTDLNALAVALATSDASIVAIPETHYYTIMMSQTCKQNANVLTHYATDFASRHDLTFRTIADRISVGPERSSELVLRALHTLMKQIGRTQTTYIAASGATNDASALNWIRLSGGCSFHIASGPVNGWPTYVNGALLGRQGCVDFFQQAATLAVQQMSDHTDRVLVDHADRVLAAEGSGIVEAP
jgi:hypothetical protein